MDILMYMGSQVTGMPVNTGLSITGNNHGGGGGLGTITGVNRL